MKTTALFDVDGTLLDSNGAHAQAWHDALERSGRDVPVAVIRPLIGMGGDRILPLVAPGLDDEREPGRTIAAQRKAIFLDRYVQHVRPTNGARALLEALHARGLRIVIATSAQADELERLLALGDFGPLIDGASTTDDAAASKPAPDIVSAALRRAGASPAEAAMIGDTRYDVEAARDAGVVSIALRCGGAEAGSLGRAAAVYADPAALLATLEASPLAA